MLLAFADGESFATGAIDYVYGPASAQDISSRIMLQLEFEGVITSAILDTGAPYVVCAPDVARRIGLHPGLALERIRMNIRKATMGRHLYRLHVNLLAHQGENLSLEATAFVPDPEWEAVWGDHPSYIGLSGCLERMRFAVDTTTDTFYFGPA